MPDTTGIQVLRASNERRQASAAERDQETARELASRLRPGTRAWQVACARRDHPQDTWAQLAARLGVSKDTATALWRRAATPAGDRPVSRRLLPYWRDDGTRVATYPTRLNTRALAGHAHRAIAHRLGYDAPDALIAADRAGDAVLLRLNSGGNALAVESWLRTRGYVTAYAGKNPGGYGCSVKVTLRTAP
jgi:hypothetical protein